MQQLRRAAPQCSAAAGPAPADASALAGQLPPAQPDAPTESIIPRIVPEGPLVPSHRDEPSPQNFPSILVVWNLYFSPRHCFALSGRVTPGFVNFAVLEMGRAAAGGDGRSWGVGKLKKIFVEAELPGLVRWTGQTQEDQNSENRDTGYGHHRAPRPSGTGFT